MLAICERSAQTDGVQCKSDPNREVLDAAALCGHLVPEGSVIRLGIAPPVAVPDELFEDLFPSGRGRPSVPADVVATVMVLQALEGLSDRDAARELRTNIAWVRRHVDEGFTVGDGQREHERPSLLDGDLELPARLHHRPPDAERPTAAESR